jgi:hypothetical protein
MPAAARSRSLKGLAGLLERELPGLIAPADRWEVDLEGLAADELSGRLERVAVRGRNVRLRDGLVIAEVALALRGLKVDVQAGSIEEIQSIAFAGRIGADAINRLAEGRGGDRIDNLRVDFRKDRMEVRGVARTDPFGLRLNVAVSGKPRQRENRVDLVLDEASVARLRVPRRFLRSFERRMNPVLDLGTLSVPARLTRIAIEDRHLVAEAILEVPPAAVAEMGRR